MHSSTRLHRICVLGSAGFAVYASGALAQDMDAWTAMQDKVISAEQLLEGNVSNNARPIGEVSDLVVSEDGKRVQYILFEVSYPNSNIIPSDGFVEFEKVTLSEAGDYDVDAMVDFDDPPRKPEEIELTADEAQQRLMSRILAEEMAFSADESRKIEDVLLDRETGEILHYVVETDEGTLFRAERRTVPAGEVTIGDDGGLDARIELAGLEDVQEYDPRML